MSSWALQWRGDKVLGRAHEAIRKGLAETADVCVTVAQDAAPRDTGFMANTIERKEPRVDGDVGEVEWGNWTAKYTLWQEIGTAYMAGRFFLRAGADRGYPQLARRIRSHM